MYLRLTNAPVVFMDLLNRVFQDYLDSFVIVFIDDIFVYSKSDHLRIVFQLLKKHGLFAKYSKWEFLLKSVAFVFHIVSSVGIEVDPKKMEAVKNCPRPLTPTDIKIFLGLVGYYIWFFDGFASITSLLTT